MAKVKGKVAVGLQELEQKILYCAISSRLFVLLLSFVSDMSVSDHDAGVFLSPKSGMTVSLADRVVNASLGGLVRWDAQYYLHIALHGYTYEHTLAFFPLFPLVTRIFASVLDAVFGSILNGYSTVLISAVFVNLIFFVNAAKTLFHLSTKVLRDIELAYMSTLFFCMNPASIFFTAPYSESMFAFFAFSAMTQYVSKDNGLLSGFASGLSSCTRSNGLINFGFLGHKCLKQMLASIFEYRSLVSLLWCIRHIYLICIYLFISVLPFCMYQMYAYSLYCTKQNVIIPEFLRTFGEKERFVMPNSQVPPWCNYSIPLSYSYVQNHYWNVGFLRYYEIKQIPNFLLALPIIILILSNSYKFLLENKKATITLGFNNYDRVTFNGRELKPEFTVFVFQALALTVFCALFIHVQVTTRMIASSCPIIYWFVALKYKLVTNESNVIQSRLKYLNESPKYSLLESQKNMSSLWKMCIITERPADRWSSIIRIYFISYLIIGTVLFSNFYPWT